VAYIPDRKINFGDALGSSFAQLMLIKREIGIYLAVFSGFALLMWVVDEFLSPLSGIVNLGGFVLYFYAQYRLYQELLRANGINVDDRVRVVGFIGLALMIGLALLVSVYLLIVPALILGAKWIMAPVYMVAGQRGVIQAMGDSWQASRGNTLHLTLTYTAIWVIWALVFGPVSGAFEVLGGAGLRNAVTSLLWHALPLVLMGFAMTAYKQLSDDTDPLTSVFE
jgi:hypothetical protein